MPVQTRVQALSTVKAAPEVVKPYLERSIDGMVTHGVTLENYQVKAVEFVLEHELAPGGDNVPRGGFICDDMGLGKTYEIISAMLADNVGVLTLVVVVNSVLSEWADNLRKFFPEGVYVLHPGCSSSEVVASYAQVVLAPMSLFRQDTKNLPAVIRKTKWYRMVVDEAHDIRNANTKVGPLSAAVLHVACPRSCLPTAFARTRRAPRASWQSTRASSGRSPGPPS